MQGFRALSLMSPLRARSADTTARAGIRSEEFENLMRTKKESFWMELGSKKALTLFHEAAVRVPAYKDFLRRARVDHARIRTIKDFAHVPVTNAKNYIAAYPLSGRCWDGKLASAQFIATSSGTKGEPKFWPRNAEQDFEAALIHEFLYQAYFELGNRSTLLLIGFPMGIYISGIATLLPSWLASFSKKKLSIMSVGNNKGEMLRAVSHLSDAYEQTILIGHPFFIKDVIETGSREGIGWAKKKVGLMFCSEGFSEDWRKYVMAKAGIPSSSMRVFSTYGSSEMLLMAYETPFTIMVKRMAERNHNFLSALTGDLVPPQFFQYNPVLRYIEALDRELAFTSASGIPLVRFNIHDRGDIFSLQQVAEAMGSQRKKPTYQLPLVALWGRSDDTLKFHGVNIYPEHVKAGLGNKRFMGILSGKFVLRKVLDEKMDQFLEINVELSPTGRASGRLAKEIQFCVKKTLLKINLEYADMSSHVKKDVTPRIILWPYQSPQYFKPGVKPHYIERTR